MNIFKVLWMIVVNILSNNNNDNDLRYGFKI